MKKFSLYTIFIIILIFPFKNFLIENYIEIKLTNLLGFEVEIDKINYSIINNSITINNLFIKNPPEFKYLFAITIEKIFIDNISLKSNSIDKIFIYKTNFYQDQKNGISNLTMMADNIKKFKKDLDIKNDEKIDTKNNSFFKNLLDFNLKKLIEETTINFISIDDSYFTLRYKFFNDQSISIPLEKYESHQRTINTLLSFFNEYIDITIKKLNASNRYSELISIFPKWEQEINKVRNELNNRIEINF